MHDMEERCLNNLKDLIAALYDGAVAGDPIPSRLRELYESIAERPFPLPFIFTRRLRFKRLLWRPEDFRPEILEILDRELSDGWRGIHPGDEAFEEAPPHKHDPVKEAAGDGDVKEPKAAVAAPRISETTLGRHLGPHPVASPGPGPAASAAFTVKEDLFDRFVGWVAALVS